MNPVLYHTHHSLRSEDIPFWRDLAGRFGGPILELGCGTGRVLLRLLRDNFQVVGIDNDPGMLAFLRRMIPPTLGTRIDVVEGDMLDLDLGIQFPLIILPCNTLSTFGREDRMRIFGGVRKHLAPGGTFVFSMPNPMILSALPETGELELEDEFSHPTTGHPVQVFSSWQKRPNQVTFHWRYDHIFPDGRVNSVDHSSTHDLDPPQTYMAEVNGCGLKPAAAFGSFDRDEYRPDSSYFILLARPSVLALR